jgi:hypothetical protein
MSDDETKDDSEQQAEEQPADSDQPADVSARSASTERLRLKVPPVPDDSTISTTHYVLEAVEAIDIVVGVGGGDAFMAIVTGAGAGSTLLTVMEGAGVAVEGFLTVAAPLAAMAAEFVALGLPYAEARTEIANKRLATGMSHGVVMAADGRKPSLVKSYFWEYDPEVNVMDEDAGRIAQNAYNLGLVSGYRQALELNDDQRATFWKDIGDLVGDTSYLGDSKDWNERAWIDWYILAGAKFQVAHMS